MHTNKQDAHFSCFWQRPKKNTPSVEILDQIYQNGIWNICPLRDHACKVAEAFDIGQLLVFSLTVGRNIQSLCNSVSIENSSYPENF